MRDIVTALQVVGCTKDASLPHHDVQLLFPHGSVTVMTTDCSFSIPSNNCSACYIPNVGMFETSSEPSLVIDVDLLTRLCYEECNLLSFSVSRTSELSIEAVFNRSIMHGCDCGCPVAKWKYSAASGMCTKGPLTFHCNPCALRYALNAVQDGNKFCIELLVTDMYVIVKSPENDSLVCFLKRE